MSEEISALSRGASSLALMMLGFDKELDQSLSAFRKVLKQQALDLDEFKSALKDVEDIYDSVEGIAEKSIKTYTRSFEVLFDGKLVDVIQPLKQSQPAILDLLRLADPLASHINVLSKTQSEEVVTASVDKPDAKDELSDIRRRLGTRFQSLLDALAEMGNEDKALNSAKNASASAPSWDTLDQMAAKSVALLRERLNEEQVHFEGYLAELTEKLNRISKIVDTDAATLLDLKKLNADFNTSINAQMREARSKIDEQHKVDVLKVDLLQSLDKIATRLESYQQDYNASVHNLESSKAEMSKQLNELQEENQKLLEDLHEARKLSTIDTLTQLPNRQGFNTRLDEELSRARRYEQDLSIAVIDIDFFKRINDGFGHLIGDKLLHLLATVMRKVCRKSDYLARFGGEEFVLLMPQTNLDTALSAAQKIRKHIENCPFQFKNTPVKITVSIGVAQLKADEDTEQWIERADQALYQSKHDGRNRVTAH